MTEYRSGIIEAGLEKGGRVLAQGVEFCLQSGRTLAIIGESGSGKTTVAYSVMKLLPKNVTAKGLRFVLNGEDLSDRKSIRRYLGDKIVYIPQSGFECLNPSRKIKFQIYDTLKKLGYPKYERVIRTLQTLNSVGFSNPEEIMEKYPFELSGGMAQRVVIAIAACASPELVIADEPTNGLDKADREEFFGLMNGLFSKAAKLLITHDVSVARTADECIVLCKGKVMEKGNARGVLSCPRSPYTRALMGSLIENGMREVPRLRSGESRCPFYSRCVQAGQKCLNGEIPIKEDGGVYYACALC